MRRIRSTLAGGLAAVLAAACATDRPTEAGAPDPTSARATAGYTSVDIGASIAGYSSIAHGVNDRGEVAGATCCGAGAGAFALVGGTVTPLPGENGRALAISNGSPTYLVGHAGPGSRPVRWSLDALGQPFAFALLAGELSGVARSVNAAGAAVGNAGRAAAMWQADGSRTPVAAPAGYPIGQGRGINDAGLAVFVFSVSTSETSVARGYLRLASGQLVALPPLDGDVTSYANGLSEVSGGAVYVAGTTRTSQYAFRGVRWRVDAATGQILSIEVRPEMSHALAVSDAGAVAGYLEANAQHTPRLDAFLWRGGELLRLDAPKGGNDGRAWAESRNGRYVAGEAMVSLTRHAVRWTIGSP